MRHITCDRWLTFLTTGNNLVVRFPKGKQYQYRETRDSIIAGDPNLPINPLSVILSYKTLLERMPGNKSHLLFPALASSMQGDRCLNRLASYDSVRNQFKILIKEVGLSKDATEFGLHSMRRGGATAAVNANADEHFVQKQMQVASGATVRRYGTVNKENLAKISWAVLRG